MAIITGIYLLSKKAKNSLTFAISLKYPSLEAATKIPFSRRLKLNKILVMKISPKINVNAGKNNWCCIGHTRILIYYYELEKP